MADESDAGGAEVTRIVAVRHGETVWNAEMRMQGQLDTVLSARGERQARRTAAALADEGIEAEVRDGLTGVWAPKGKIASIGVRVKNRVTMHGLAVNVDNDLQPFEWIAPCGMEGAQMSSVCRETGEAGHIDSFREALVARLCEALGREARVVVSTSG